MLIETGGVNSEDIPPDSVPGSQGIEVVDDDPETVWGLWDTATEENESRFGDMHPSAFESVLVRDKAMSTPSTSEMSSNANADHIDGKITAAFLAVANQYPDIASTVRSLWGSEDCTLHINKLVVEGIYDNGGLAMDAAGALLDLADLHEAKFGSRDGMLDLDLG